MRTLLLLFFLLLSSCAQGPVWDVPAEAQPYVDRFKAEAQSRGKVIEDGNLTLKFEKPAMGDVWGDCTGSGLYPLVQIDPDIWGTLMDTEKEELVFHELGHCFLHKSHVTGTSADGGASHIMGADLPFIQDYQAYRTQFLDDLFQ